ncbi:MAG: T9SS type A sorting domain-containing protein [Bacteroidota bacterium]
MKKSLLVFSSILLFMCLLFNSATAQRSPLLTIIRTDAEDPYISPPPKGPCDQFIIYGVTLTNLDEFPENAGASESGFYVLASHHDDMYLRITRNGVPQLYALTQFQQDANSPEAFLWFFREEIGICKDNNDIITLDWKMELLTKQGTQYVPYPVCSFVEEGEIFDCSLIASTNPFCTDPAPFCDNVVLTKDEGTQTLICDNCILSQNTPIHDVTNPTQERTNTKNNNQGLLTGTIQTLTATPNPFNQYLQIRFAKDKTPKAVSLYNLRGQKIKSWQSTNGQDAFQLSWDTADMPSGTYIIQAQFDDYSNTSMKVIKP